jgi:hypothetical protein
VAGMPWFLLAGGIGLVILGAILASLPKSSGRGRRSIDADMRDDEIVRELRRAQRVPVSGLIFMAGVVCILVSLGWRLARYFM